MKLLFSPNNQEIKLQAQRHGLQFSCDDPKVKSDQCKSLSFVFGLCRGNTESNFKEAITDKAVSFSLLKTNRTFD